MVGGESPILAALLRCYGTIPNLAFYSRKKGLWQLPQNTPHLYLKYGIPNYNIFCNILNISS